MTRGLFDVPASGSEPSKGAAAARPSATASGALAGLPPSAFPGQTSAGCWHCGAGKRREGCDYTQSAERIADCRSKIEAHRYRCEVRHWTRWLGSDDRSACELSFAHLRECRGHAAADALWADVKARLDERASA